MSYYLGYLFKIKNLKFIVLLLIFYVKKMEVIRKSSPFV